MFESITSFLQTHVHPSVHLDRDFPHPFAEISLVLDWIFSQATSSSLILMTWEYLLFISLWNYLVAQSNKWHWILVWTPFSVCMSVRFRICYFNRSPIWKIGVRGVKFRDRWRFMEQSRRTEKLKKNLFPDLILEISDSTER